MDNFNAIDHSENASFNEIAEINFYDILEVIVENIRLLVFAPIIFGLLGFGISFLITPKYTASTLFLPPQQQAGAAASMLQSLGALGGIAGAAGIKNPTDQYVSFLKTRIIQDAVIDGLSLKSHYQEKYNEDYRRTLLKNSNITAGKDNILKIEVTDKDKKLSADIANKYVEELTVLMSKFAITEAQNRRVFFEKQLSETKKKLTEAQINLSKSGVDLTALNMNPGTAVEGPARLKAQITAQEVKLASMRSYLTDKAPEFRQALSELNELKKNLSDFELRDDKSSNSKSSDYIIKYREYKYQETLFDIFSRQYEVARVDEGREGPMIQVIDYAEVPEKKSSPKKILLALGSAVAGLFFCFIYIFMRNFLNSTHENPSNSEKLKKMKKSLKNQLKLKY